jgi:hypothetical protein
VGHHIAQQDDGHVFVGVAYRRFAAAEEVENRVEECQHHGGERHTDDGVEHHHVAQHTPGRVVVALS